MLDRAVIVDDSISLVVEASPTHILACASMVQLRTMGLSGNKVHRSLAHQRGELDFVVVRREEQLSAVLTRN